MESFFSWPTRSVNCWNQLMTRIVPKPLYCYSHCAIFGMWRCTWSKIQV